MCLFIILSEESLFDPCISKETRRDSSLRSE
jgi:hypothetical protein